MITPATPIGDEHDLATFNSGVDSLDRWLRERARYNEREDASRTYVVSADRKVVAYYCIATSSIVRNAAGSRIGRNMPDPLPVILIGRLAVDLGWRRRDLGRSLLHDALKRCIAAAVVVGVRAVIVDAISAEAEAFYERYGFRKATGLPRTLVMSMQEARRFMQG